jgi:integrase
MQCSQAETPVDTGWIFFREETTMSKSTLVEQKEPYLQPSPAPVPDLPQTRKRVRRRYDCQPPTFAETLFGLAERTRHTTVRSVAGVDYQVLPDHASELGLRDRALLAFSYNTGARISEVLAVSTQDLRLESPFQVRLFGKGRKERICPLWPETVHLLKVLLSQQKLAPNEIIFRNRYGEPLSASGVRFRLRAYLVSATQKAPRLATKRITPHTFRHTAAVHLLESGVDVAVVKDWLGHASLDSTYIYARANLETKRKALQHLELKTPGSKRKAWKQTPGLMAWLDSL